MTGPYEPPTPVSAEAKLEAFSEEMRKATEAYVAACDAETDAAELHREAYEEALLSERCPQVGVFNGVRVTVAMQEAWVNREIRDQVRLLNRARNARRTAEAYLHMFDRQGSHQQTITKSVGSAYDRTTGRGRW